MYTYMWMAASAERTVITSGIESKSICFEETQSIFGGSNAGIFSNIR